METSALPLAGATTIRSAGLDLVDIERLRLAHRRSGPGFLHRVFTSEELTAATNAPAPTWEVLGRLFGIKESVVKAAGGFPRGARYLDISIDVRFGSAEWPVQLHGELASWATGAGLELFGGGRTVHNGLGLAWIVGRTPAGTTEAARSAGAEPSTAGVSPS